MNLFTAERPQDDRYAIALGHRMTAVVLVPFDGYVVLGFFWKDQLFFVIDHAIGDA